jgi:hypothetical protein
MAFNVQNFLSGGLTQGGARPTLFDVSLAIPAGIGNGTTIEQKFNLTCSATTIPAASIGLVEVPYFGRKIKLAGDRTFDNWTVTVLNDEDFLVRDAFEAWSNYINQIVGNTLTPAFIGNQYKTNAVVSQYAKGANPNGSGITIDTGAATGTVAPATSIPAIKSYLFQGLFPLNVSEMGVDWNTTDNIQSFQVTFAYDFWIPYPGNATA